MSLHCQEVFTLCWVHCTQCMYVLSHPKQPQKKDSRGHGLRKSLHSLLRWLCLLSARPGQGSGDAEMSQASSRLCQNLRSSDRKQILGHRQEYHWLKLCRELKQGEVTEGCSDNLDGCHRLGFLGNTLRLAGRLHPGSHTSESQGREQHWAEGGAGLWCLHQNIWAESALSAVWIWGERARSLQPHPGARSFVGVVAEEHWQPSHLPAVLPAAWSQRSGLGVWGAQDSVSQGFPEAVTVTSKLTWMAGRAPCRRQGEELSKQREQKV